MKKARVNTELCLGCGVCVPSCGRDGLRLEARPARVLTPVDSAHRIVLDAIEQGKLANLIFDQQTPNHRVLAAILGEFHRLFETYAAAGFPALRGAWEQRNAFADLPVAVRGESATLYGTCIGVDDDGALLLRGEDGIQRVLAGDVSLRPLMDGPR